MQAEIPRLPSYQITGFTTEPNVQILRLMHGLGIDVVKTQEVRSPIPCVGTLFYSIILLIKCNYLPVSRKIKTGLYL